MKKLKLDLDAVRVDTFDTGAGRPRGAGTVHARQEDGIRGTENSPCTLWESCPGSCRPDECPPW